MPKENVKKIFDGYLEKHNKINNSNINLKRSAFLIVFIFFVTLLIGIIQNYFPQSFLVSLDKQILNNIYNFRNDALLNFFYFVTLFAEASVIVVASVFISVFFWIRKQRIYIFSLWFALLVGEGLTFFEKYLFQRERPDILFRAVSESSFSFPSGHATVAVLFYGFFVYLIVKNYKSWKVRAVSFLSIILLIIFVDFSRLYLGVHYLTDVVAGNLIGLASLIFSIGIMEWIISRKQKLESFKF